MPASTFKLDPESTNAALGVCSGGRGASEPPRDPRVRLLVVSPTLAGGGAERFTSSLLCGLDRQTFAPSLCLLRPEIRYPLPTDVPIISLDKHRPWHFARTVKRLRRLIESTRPDIVLSTISSTNWMTGLALRGVDRRPRWIARVGNDPALHDGVLGGWLNRKLYSAADVFVANSRGLAGSLAAGYPRHCAAVRVIGNPADLSLLAAQASQPPKQLARPGVPVIVSVNRLTRQKRPDLLIDAFARLRRRRLAELWICGDGPMRGRVERQIKAAGLGECVRLFGFCGNPHALMRQAAVFALTSDHEGLPNALIEAQCLGLPAVATRCPHGPDEIIDDGRTGLLVECGNAAAIATALEALLADPPRRTAMGQAAAVRAAAMFDSSRMIEHWQHELLALNPPDRRAQHSAA